MVGQFRLFTQNQLVSPKLHLKSTKDAGVLQEDIEWGTDGQQRGIAGRYRLRREQRLLSAQDELSRSVSHQEAMSATCLLEMES